MFPYYRLSVLKGDAALDGGSTERQSERMHWQAGLRGADVCAEFSDDAISAAYNRAKEDKPRRRPGFRALLAAIETYQPDYIGSVYGSRLSRNLTEYQELTDVCTRAGTKIATETEGDTDPADTNQYGFGAMRTINDAAYAEKARQAVKSKNAERRRNGMPVAGGRRWYGFDPDKVTPRQSEADVILRIADALLHGEGLAAICRTLDDDAVPTPSETTAETEKATARAKAYWDAQTVRKLLRRPANAGLLAHEGEIIGEYAAVESGAVEPMMTRDYWHAVQSVLDGNSARALSLSKGMHVSKGTNTRTDAGRLSILSGLLICTTCNGRMMASTGKKKTGERVRRYVCKRGHQSIPALDAEGLARDFVIAYGSDERYMHTLAAAAEERSADWHALDEQLRELRAELHELATGIDAATGEPLNRTYANRRANVIDANVADVKERMKAIDPSDPGVSLSAQTKKLLISRWDAAANTDRRAMISAVTSGFRITPAGRGYRVRIEDRMTPIGID